MTTNSRIRVGVVLLDDSNKIIVVRMHRENSSDIYVLPGGGVENGEGLFEAAIRETKEETHLNIEITKILYLKSLYTSTENALEVILLGKIKSGIIAKGFDPEEKGKNTLKEVLLVRVADLKDLNFHPTQLKELLADDVKQGFNKSAVYLGNFKYPEK